MCSIQCLAKQTPKILGFTQFDQPTERSIRIGGGCIDKEASLILRSIDFRVYPFPDTSGVVPTFEGQLPDQQMR